MSRRYHTNLKIKYVLGLLQPEVSEIIPFSTKKYWKSIDINTYLGIDDTGWDRGIDTLRYVVNRKAVFRLLRTIMKIEQAAGEIIDSLKNREKILRNFKVKIISTIDDIKNFTGLARAMKIFRITGNQYRFWKKTSGCVVSPLQRCRKIYYNQLTSFEVGCLKSILFNNSTKNWPLISRYFEMMREKKAFISLSTFYRYSRLLGFSRIAKINFKKYKEGLRAQKPLQIIHTDFTELRIKDRMKVYVSFVVDNYSRYILGCKISTSKGASVTMQNLEYVYNKYLLNATDIKLIVDDGSENKGVTDDFLKTTSVQKMIAQSDITFSNSMVEALNKKMKYEYWLHPEEYDLRAFESHTEKSVNDYNHRPHGALKGLTPHEALNNLPCPNYANEIRLAAQNRPIINQTEVCGVCKQLNQ